jgi:hypothetical protein
MGSVIGALVYSIASPGVASVRTRTGQREVAFHMLTRLSLATFRL